MRRLGLGLWLMALIAPAAAGQDNLLKNGGFGRKLAAWFWLSNSQRASARVSKGVLHIAKRGGFPADVLGQAFELPAKKRSGSLTLSARVKGSNVGNSWLKLFLYDAQGRNLLDEVDVKQLRGSFGWQTVARTFVIPKGAVRGKVLLQVFLGGEIWVDAVDVTFGETKIRPRAKTRPLDRRTQQLLDRHAVPLRTLEPGGDLSDLAPLKKALQGVRIVQLGENTHGDGACFLVKCRLIRWLHEELDFDVVAFESGLFECDRANAFVRRGGDPKDVLRAGIFKVWHTRRTLPLFAYLNATAGTPRPMALAGFDPQQGGELAHDFVPRLLQFFRDAGVDKPATFRFLEEIAQALTGERYRPRPVTPQAFLKLRALFADRREALVQEHGARETAFFQRAFENYTVHERLRRTDGAEAFNLRDEWMGKNLIWLAEERFPKKKIVVWAATRHVAHGLKGVRGLDGAPYHDTKSMGEWVHEHFGRQCYTIGFAAHGGRGGRWFSGKWDLPPPAPGSIEDTLFRYGKPRLFLNLRGPTPFDKPLHLGVLAYARDLRARWPQVIDGLVYIEQMVPAAYMGD